MQKPAYRCSFHMQKYYESGKLPDCMKSQGCLIGEDLAVDPDVDHLVSNYYMVKSAPICETLEKIGVQLLDDVGLLEHTDLLMRLESAYYQHHQNQKQLADIKQSHKNMRR